MKSETALLIDTDLSRTLSTSLRAILEPLFRLDSIVHKGPETVFSRDDLGTLKDAQPVLIFVILSNNLIAAVGCVRVFTNETRPTFFGEMAIVGRDQLPQPRTGTAIARRCRRWQ